MKKSKLFIAILILMLPLVSIFFPIHFAEKEVADATISGLAATQYRLTGKIGSSVTHYFTDERNESTLVGAKVSNEGGTHYSIVPNTGGTLGKISSGSGEIEFTSDMIALIEKGLVYAYASFDFTSSNGNNQSNINIVLSSGSTENTLTTSNTKGQTRSYTTQEFKVDKNAKSIKFAFTTLEKTSVGNYSSFVLAMPTIHFFTVAQNLVFENTDQFVTPGRSVTLKAYNEITNITSVAGDFISYAKLVHKVKFDIIEGGDFVTIIDNTLFVNQEVADGTKIKIKATAASKLNGKVLQSKVVTFTVSSSRVTIAVQKDFKNPAMITGEGDYIIGEIVSLNLTAYEGYQFEGWYFGDQFKSKKTRYTFKIENDVDYSQIYAKFIKNISITSVEAQKVYDKTDNLQSFVVNFDGKEEEHELSISGISFKFATSNVYTGILQYDVEKLANIALLGENSKNYNLVSQNIPETVGIITQKEVLITPDDITAEYGDNYTLTFVSSGIVEGDSLAGSLGVEGEGIAVDSYQINLGNLQAQNPNYSFKLANEATLTIVQRELDLELIAEDKVYDGNNQANVTAKLSNIVANEDVSVAVENALFSQSDAGFGLAIDLTLDNFVISGQDKDNYCIKNFISPHANITQKEVFVAADAKEFVYGDEIELTYSVDGLLAGDELAGNVSIESTDAGLYNIENNLTSSANYKIVFNTATCLIKKRPTILTVTKAQKEFGDVDPVIEYSFSNLIEGDIFAGSLAREAGEMVGEYKITQGTLLNKNYQITINEESAVFSILKRQIAFNVSFEDKEYDGTNYAPVTIVSVNTLATNPITITIDAHLSQKDVGSASVIKGQTTIVGDNQDQHDITINYLTDTILIAKRKVTVTITSAQSKVYGEADPELTFVCNNVVEGETLVGSPKRNVGESAGNYSFYLDTLTDANNPNYSISLSQATFTIQKRQITLTTQNTTKIFGEKDPVFIPTLTGEGTLANGEKFEDVIVGYLSREEGEEAGSYRFTTDNLEISENYDVTIDVNFVISRRSVTVICDNKTKTYGDEDPVFTYRADNVVEGYPLSLDIRREYGEDVGEYSLIQGSLSDARYIITFVPATLTIYPSNITVTAEAKVKVYGDDEPYYNVIITEGLLKNNDQLAGIMQGSLTRDEGENVGRYEIKQGTMTLGQNYNVKYQSQYLEIIKRDIEISIESKTKVYGEIDEKLSYVITKGQLCDADAFTGELARDAGEYVGDYQITLGTLALSSNYNLTYIPNIYKIEKRHIEIIPYVEEHPSILGKTYGEIEPTLTYRIIGKIIDGDVLSGQVVREKPVTDANPLLYENAGKYNIICTLENSNYDIAYAGYSFVISARVIEIKADDKEMTYGEKEPELSYTIKNEGDILEKDKPLLQGNVYRLAGKDAGEYDIRSSLTLGRNYRIDFTKGIFKIKPIEIQIRCQNYTKTYGEFDPIFEYEIVVGKVLEGEELYGNIGRVQGENKGIYELVSNLSNINYNITFEKTAFLTINTKAAYLLAGVHDKIYDGSNKATIKTPVVSGLIDKDVTLSYDKDNCVNFVTAEVGNDIEVAFHDITLVGEKAENYHLVYPTDVRANIAYKELSKGDVKITSTTAANLYFGSSLDYNTFDIDRKEMGLAIRRVLKGYDIYLENDGKKIDVTTSVTITIDLSDEIKSCNNLYIYHKDENGKFTLISSKRDEDGRLLITTDKLGQFVIMTDNDAWIELGAYICLGILLLLILIATLVYFKKNKALKKQQKQEQAEKIKNAQDANAALKKEAENEALLQQQAEREEVDSQDTIDKSSQDNQFEQEADMQKDADMQKENVQEDHAQADEMQEAQNSSTQEAQASTEEKNFEAENQAEMSEQNTNETNVKTDENKKDDQPNE